MDYFLFRKFIVNYSLKRADKIVAVTKETKDFLIKTHKISPKRIFLIPLGVDIDFFKFDNNVRINIRKKFKIRKNDVVLAFSGTIVRRKGVELLLTALSEIKNENVKLMIVGSGDIAYVQELKDLAKRLGIESKVIFIGFVKKEDVKNYFSAADIGVWPCNNSVSIMEAMACKLPIVMVALQLSHLVSYNNGLKFPENNKEKLKFALENLINNKALRLRMANNSVNAVKKYYSYDEIAKLFITLTIFLAAFPSP